MEERYVSFDVAKLLKARGFNAICRSFYKTWNDSTSRYDANKSQRFDYCTNSSLEAYNAIYEEENIEEENISAPTQQMAQDFLMKDMELLVLVDCDRPMHEKHRLKFKYFIIDTRTNKFVYIDEEYFDMYKDAMNAGLYKALNEFENLTAERKS